MINPIVSTEKAFSLEGKNAIVTGGNAGIGLAAATAFAQNGANVAILCRNMEKAKSALDELAQYGGKYESFSCDVKDLKSVRKAVSEVYESFGNIDILVNNSGISHLQELLDMNDDFAIWHDIMDTNLNGLVYMTYEVCKRMRDAGRGGSVINISSIAAVMTIGTMPMAPYYASKAAVDHLTRSLAMEFAKYDIRVNAIQPGFARTDLARHIPQEKFEKITSMIPLGRWGEPIEVGAMALYFASPASAHVTGTSLTIDGGYMLP